MDNPSRHYQAATPFTLDSHNGPSPHHDGADRGPATGLHLELEMKRNESSARFRQTGASANGTGSGIKALAMAGRHLAHADVFADGAVTPVLQCPRSCIREFVAVQCPRSRIESDLPVNHLGSGLVAGAKRTADGRGRRVERLTERYVCRR